MHAELRNVDTAACRTHIRISILLFMSQQQQQQAGASFHIGSANLHTEEFEHYQLRNETHQHGLEENGALLLLQEDALL